METIYDEFKQEIIKEERIRQLYRFQGGKSLSHLKDTGIPLNTGYVYFSKSMKHHQYFITKRLRQLIRETLYDQHQIVFSKKSLTDQKSFECMKTIVTQNPVFDQLNSFSFTIGRVFCNLLKENMVFNDHKNSFLPLPERVDKKKYGGGYGISKEWLALLNSFTFLSECRHFKEFDLLSILNNFKNNSIYGIKKVEIIDFLEEHCGKIMIKEEFFSSYHKYQIMENLENILEKELGNKESLLFQKPRETIRKTIEEYSALKEYLLNTLEKHYQKHL